MISVLQNVLNFQILMMSQLLKAGEEIEMMEVTEEVAEEAEEATAVVAAMEVAAATAAVAVATVMMEVTLGGAEEEEEEVVEVEEAAEEDMEIEMEVEATEVAIEAMTEEAASMTIKTMEALEVETLTEEVTNTAVVAVININKEALVTTTKVSPDHTLPSQLSEAAVPHSSATDFNPNQLYKNLLVNKVSSTLATSRTK